MSLFHPAMAQNQGDAAEGSRFAGAVLVIYTGDRGSGAVIEKARLEILGVRQFVVGTSLDVGDNDWTRRAEVWLAADSISQMIRFNNRAQYIERAATYDNTQSRGRSNRPTGDSSPRGGGL